MSTLAQQRRIVEQLRRESEIKRTNVSIVLEDLKVCLIQIRIIPYSPLILFIINLYFFLIFLLNRNSSSNMKTKTTC